MRKALSILGMDCIMIYPVKRRCVRSGRTCTVTQMPERPWRPHTILSVFTDDMSFKLYVQVPAGENRKHQCGHYRHGGDGSCKTRSKDPC